MWEKMSEPWKACFEEAWKAYCKGSIPIGSVIVSIEGEILSRGRNMTAEDVKKPDKLSGNRIAHAEMNAIYSIKQGLKNTIIYTTMEPCIMCFGAIVMSGIKEINYAARDGIAGGTNLRNDYISKRNVKINDHDPELEIVQLVIKTDYLYRSYGEKAEELLCVWEQKCPIGIQLGRIWYRENRLVTYKKGKYNIGQIIDEIMREALSFKGGMYLGNR